MNEAEQFRAAARQRVAVHGRPGVGTGAVLAALRALDRFDVSDVDVDVTVRVVAETVKPEDVQAVMAAAGPVLVVLTKADTHPLGRGGPVETARRRCAALAEVAGAPVVPMVGLLAVAALDPSVLDDELMRAVRTLAVEPADLRTADAFLSCAHGLPVGVRRQLIEKLDLFGIAHAVVAVRNHPAATVDDVRAALRRAGALDVVIDLITDLGAEGRYRRLRAALATLELAAITDRSVAGLLHSDEVILTRVAAATQVLCAAGAPIGPVEHVERARHWQRYGQGPVSAVHRACAADLTAGSLLLWSSR